MIPDLTVQLINGISFCYDNRTQIRTDQLPVGNDRRKKFAKHEWGYIVMPLTCEILLTV